MPRALRLSLEPGDLAFFHTNTLHRGLYPAGVLRRTIAVTYTRVSAPWPLTAEAMKRSGGYEAPYQPWFLKPGYLDGCTVGAREFHQRLIDVHRDNWRVEYLETLPAKLRAYYTAF